ncbi:MULTISPECIES: hypothetical protein [Streptomyces]|uniref:Secreted protein n=1 Tax=Streptomyces ramulosus TaxID=47762 RepID=A0ABW1FG50_9ACTN
MRHPVRRSLALAAATVGLLAFGATAAHADSDDWLPTEQTPPVVWNAVAATDGDRVILPPSDGGCDAAPGETCRTYPEDPSGYSVVPQASTLSDDEGKLIPRIPAEDGFPPVRCTPDDGGRIVCMPV